MAKFDQKNPDAAVDAEYSPDGREYQEEVADDQTDAKPEKVKRPAKPDNSHATGTHNGDGRRVSTRGFHKVK